MIRHTARRIVLALLVTCGAVNVADALTLGVLAARPKPVMEARFRPLADYLSTQLKGVPVKLEILDSGELEQALAQHRLDLVLTNPSSYLVLRSQNSLSGALATMVSLHAGQATASMGGVIITQAARTDIAALTDLRGRRIAIPNQASLGGYQAQAFELLQAGIRLPRAVTQAATGGGARKTGSRTGPGITLQTVGTDDAVVAAVLDGSAEVGFVRVSAIENLATEGRLDPSRLRIVNRQPLAAFPYPVSTRLYPDCPIVALPQVDQDTVRRITAALLALEADHPAARAAGIAGFAPPADYLPVENLLRTLRLPPYDRPAAISWDDVWQRDRLVVLAAALSAAAILGLLVLLATRNRRLARDEAALARTLAEQQAIMAAIPYPIFEVDADGCVLGSWVPSVKTTAIDPRQLVGNRVTETLPAAASEQAMSALREAGERGLAQGRQFSLPTAAGEQWFEISASLIADSANPRRFAVLVRNITDQRENEKWLKIAASVFTHAGEGILISGPDSRILAANRAFTRIMGYPDDENLIGRYTRELRLDYLGGESFDTLRQGLMQHGHWQGELRGQRETGELFSVTLNVNVARDETGQVSHHVAVLTDITLLKEQQNQLEHIAYHDALTGLPNRTLLADRLEQAMARAGRRNERVAVVYVDLDGFKAVNDTYGHDEGDSLLIALAGRMRSGLREGDTLARIGGDEFVAVLADLACDQDGYAFLDRLLAEASEPIKGPWRSCRCRPAWG